MGGAISRCFWTGDNSRGSVTPSAGQPDSPQNTFPDVPLTPKVGNDACEGPLLRVFTYNELRSATRNFRPDSMLGEGGFGRVFKGWIDEHGTLPVKPGTGLTVAVKKLNQDGHQGHREWLAEVNCLGQLRHPNLVKLIGYCIEDDHRLLVYEFMPRGSLENHLFRKGALPLTWAIRMKVALCAAQGLAFLHGANTIYRDFKTSNILLDHDYTAKLSDFGLAKDGPEGDKTHVSTRIMGTYGYAAPEYVMTGHLTAKSDVYSFGVVLLEMLTGKRSMDKSRSHGEQNLVEWAKHYLNDKRRVLRLLDPKLEGQVAVKAFQKAAALARNCLSKDSKSRPLMPDVLRTLESLQVTSDITGHHQSSVSGIQNTGGVQQVANGNSNRYQSLPARQNSGNSSSNGPARGSGGSRYHQSPRASVNR